MELKLWNHKLFDIFRFTNWGHGHVHINNSAINNILMEHI